MNFEENNSDEAVNSNSQNKRFKWGLGFFLLVLFFVIGLGFKARYVSMVLQDTEMDSQDVVSEASDLSASEDLLDISTEIGVDSVFEKDDEIISLLEMESSEGISINDYDMGIAEEVSDVAVDTIIADDVVMSDAEDTEVDEIVVEETEIIQEQALVVENNQVDAETDAEELQEFDSARVIPPPDPIFRLRGQLNNNEQLRQSIKEQYLAIINQNSKSTFEKDRRVLREAEDSPDVLDCVILEYDLQYDCNLSLLSDELAESFVVHHDPRITMSVSEVVFEDIAWEDLTPQILVQQDVYALDARSGEVIFADRPTFWVEGFDSQNNLIKRLDYFFLQDDVIVSVQFAIDMKSASESQAMSLVKSFAEQFSSIDN